jgi:tRNA pseudouridine38-40 synthase
MRRILLTVAYDGTEYHGWQVQEGVTTIEGELNRAIGELTGVVTEVIGASRTDAGVHGRCNRAVFDTESTIPADRFSAAINTFLPHDIRVTSSAEVAADWHPRKVLTYKTYEYHIDRSEIYDPLRERYTWNVWGELDLEKMREAAAYLTGEHDFTSFCAAASPVEDKVREIISIDILEHGREVIIRVKGTGFLYNMVRIIAGTLVAVGQGKTEPEQMAEILDARDRSKAGQTAPAKGLVLVLIEDVR